MNWIDILKKAEEIENHYILIEEETPSECGVAIKLTAAPQIKLMYITETNKKESKSYHGIDIIKIGKTLYIIRKTLCINVNSWDKLKKEVDNLLNQQI